MSVPETFPKEIPPQTRQIVESWLDKTSMFTFLGQHVDEIVGDADFAPLYASGGRSGVNAVVLALVTVFQFLEDLPDRAAAEQARSRMDWKYALRQELTWSGFHYSDLCNFRKRLLAHDQAGLVFERVLDYLKSHGYIRAGGKQRTDATHVLGQLRQLSRLELVLESLRLALSALVSVDAHWFMQTLPATYTERYQGKRADYRLNAAERDQLLLQAGQDGVWLLQQLAQAPQLQGLEAVQVLQRVWHEQFSGEQVADIAIDPEGDCEDGPIQSPHDPEARYGRKRGKDWQGYKAQVTDTADDGPHFITDIHITAANVSDQQALAGIQGRLQQRALRPAKQYVDQAYLGGAALASSRQQGIDLRGYVQSQASSKAPGFRLQDFTIDMAQQVAICPTGQQSVQWSTVSGTKGVAYRAFFGQQCRDCPFFNDQQCTTQRGGRRLDISRHHDELQRRRHEMQDPAFQREMHTRHGVEGTLSELVRCHGLRRARYRGQVKIQFQAYFAAAAFNLKHLVKACLFLLLACQHTVFRHFSQWAAQQTSIFQQDHPSRSARNL